MPSRAARASTAPGFESARARGYHRRIMSTYDTLDVCGTALASIDRRADLQSAVDLLDVAAHREGPHLVVTLTVRSEDVAPLVNVHHSAEPDGG